MSTTSRISAMPSWPMSSSRPTNGETNRAPAFAASSACGAEKQRVTLTSIGSSWPARMWQARSPSQVSGTLTTTFGAMPASARPCSTMPSHAVSVTSADTGPGTSRVISVMTSLMLRPVRATREGLVVTPSTSPVAASSAIWPVSAVSTNSCMRALPSRNGSVPEAGGLDPV